MKSAKRIRSCDNYDRRWAASEASISEVDGSRESSKLLLPLLSDIAAVPGRGVSAATANWVNYDQIASTLTTIKIASTMMVR
jgi:hypothetical protein